MRYKPTREAFTPKAYAYTVKDKNSDAIVYVVDAEGPKPWAMGFAGKKAKPVWNYSFRSVEKMQEYIAQFFAGIANGKARKAEYKAERNKASELQVGDVLQAMWGYDQTNIDYYEVTKVISAAYVEIREIAQYKAETGFMSGKCSPKVGDYIGPAMRKRVQNGNRVKIYSFANAYKIEPKVINGAKVYDASNWTAYA